jgi:hypothetical protein
MINKNLIHILFFAFFLTSNNANSEENCKIKVFQNDIEITPTFVAGFNEYQILPSEFKLDVSPASCAPTMATIPNKEVLTQIVRNPLLYSQRWAHVYVANQTDADKLLWWATTEFDSEFLKIPDPNTFDGKQYLLLCEEFKFCPTVYPLFSSIIPFKRTITGDKAQAIFKRLDEKLTFENVKGKSAHNVIYTLWRSLPSQYPMADWRELLFKANLVRFKFLDSQTTKP